MPAPILELLPTTISTEQFGRVCGILHRVCGIYLQPGKEQLVKARLWKRIQSLGMAGFGPYLDFVESQAGAQELACMVDALTTNKTSFFREAQHFEFLRKQLRGWFAREPRLRIWSAGCSSGQEPYTIAITVLEEIPDAGRRDARILATDISARMLTEARAGAYGADDLAEVPAAALKKFFGAPGPDGLYKVADPLRQLVSFARLNLMEPWPMQGPFDFIFCRNVMIYFDKPTQQELIRRFGELLRPGGYLLVGHSESLTGRAEKLSYVLPAVYRK